MMQMMQQAQKMQQNMQKVEEEMASALFKGEAGGGAVTVTMTGKNVVTEVKIDPKLIIDAEDEDDAEAIADMVQVAANAAQENVQKALQERMASATGGMNIPGLM